MGLRLITAPGCEPVTLEEAKQYLKVEYPDDDNLITSLIRSAREHCEKITRRSFISTTWTTNLDRFPGSWNFYKPAYPEQENLIFLTKSPVQEVTSIDYIASDGSSQTMESSAYVLDNISEPARISPSYGRTWPVARWQPSAVAVTYVAGYGDS